MKQILMELLTTEKRITPKIIYVIHEWYPDETLHNWHYIFTKASINKFTMLENEEKEPWCTVIRDLEITYIYCNVLDIC